MPHRLLLDTSSLTYRAFFALPKSITAPDGQPVNAVRGYLDMTAQLIRDRDPDEVVHCYDHDWRPAARVAAYPDYKAGRAAEPDELSQQFTILRQVLNAFGATQVQAVGWEADDAIGTLCAQAGDDDRIDVITGDRDLIQLVRDPVVRVLFTVRGVSKLNEYDDAGVRAQYGMPAARYADFAILRGDPSDGLPGVKGVGEKTARALVTDYESLDEMVAAAAQVSTPITPRLRAALTGARHYLDAMYEVVPIRCNLNLDERRPARDEAALQDLETRYALTGSVGRLRAALDA